MKWGDLSNLGTFEMPLWKFSVERAGAPEMAAIRASGLVNVTSFLVRPRLMQGWFYLHGDAVAQLGAHRAYGLLQEQVISGRKGLVDVRLDVRWERQIAWALSAQNLYTSPDANADDEPPGVYGVLV